MRTLGLCPSPAPPSFSLYFSIIYYIFCLIVIDFIRFPCIPSPKSIAMSPPQLVVAEAGSFFLFFLFFKNYYHCAAIHSGGAIIKQLISIFWTFPIPLAPTPHCSFFFCSLSFLSSLRSLIRPSPSFLLFSFLSSSSSSLLSFSVSFSRLLLLFRSVPSFFPFLLLSLALALSFSYFFLSHFPSFFGELEHFGSEGDGGRGLRPANRLWMCMRAADIFSPPFFSLLGLLVIYFFTFFSLQVYCSFYFLFGILAFFLSSFTPFLIFTSSFLFLQLSSFLRFPSHVVFSLLNVGFGFLQYFLFSAEPVEE